MVGVKGFEPSTSWSQTKRASQLRYTPINCEKTVPKQSEFELRENERSEDSEIKITKLFCIEERFSLLGKLRDLRSETYRGEQIPILINCEKPTLFKCAENCS